MQKTPDSKAPENEGDLTQSEKRRIMREYDNRWSFVNEETKRNQINDEDTETEFESEEDEEGYFDISYNSTVQLRF